MSWPQKDEKGCPDDCFTCQEACPVGAIEKSGKVDRLACIKHSMKSPIFSYLMKTKAFDPLEAPLIETFGKYSLEEDANVKQFKR